MSDDDCPPIEVSRRISAPAADIFRILTDPARHQDLDGSEMVQRAVSIAPISGVGDVFVVHMRSSKYGEYEMNNHVVEFEPDRLLTWEPQAGKGHPHADLPRLGHRWSYRLSPQGPDETVVTETYDCSRLPAEERRGMDNGRLWAEAMEMTLERLDALLIGG